MKTRLEQIKDGCENHPRLKDIKDPEDRSLYRCAFIDGAEWADANPSDRAFTQQKFETEKLAEELKALKELLHKTQKELLRWQHRKISGISGQAFTSYTCFKCLKEHMHHNTSVPYFCDECSDNIRKCT